MKTNNIQLLDLYALNNEKLWKMAENSKHWLVRLEAYNHSGNWQKAVKDSNLAVRIEAKKHIALIIKEN